MSAGYVYAIGIEGTTLVKIGRARDVEKRLLTLQIGLPYRLFLVVSRWVEDSMESERLLQSQLQGTHVRGEWFDAAPEALQSLFAQEMPMAPLRVPLENHLGERLLIARRRKKLSQQQLAAAVGVNKATIYRIEKGKSEDIPVGTLKKIAIELGVSADWLLGLTSDEEVDDRLALQPA
jgi:DNA-binding XRE family transcriptional regulator